MINFDKGGIFLLYKMLEKNRKLLNENEEKILSYLLENKQQINDLTIREIANKFFTVPNTIVRMCKKLGFTGFQQFKEEVIFTLKVEQSLGEISPLDDVIVKTKQLLNPEVLNEIMESIYNARNILYLCANSCLFFFVSLKRYC